MVDSPGLKTSEAQEDETGIDQDESLLVLTERGARLARRADIQGFGAREITIESNSDILLSEAEHYGWFLDVDNEAGPVNFRLPDVDSLLQPIEDNSFGGLFVTLMVRTAAFDVTFETVTPGDLRAVGAGFSLITVDKAYLGASRALMQLAPVHLYKRGGLWVIASHAGFRSAAEEDRLRPLNVITEQNYQITDADHEVPIWFNGDDPGTVTFQSDISEGTQTNYVNAGQSVASIDFGSHTQNGDDQIAAGEAAGIIVGDTVSGDDREILVASSSGTPAPPTPNEINLGPLTYTASANVPVVTGGDGTITLDALAYLATANAPALVEAPDVALLNALADTGATATGSAGSFTVSAGTNRQLGLIVYHTGADSITNVAYGGQNMIRRIDATSTGAFPAGVIIFTLGDAGIAAATDSNFVVTGSVGGRYRASAASVQFADQSLPLVDAGFIEDDLNSNTILLGTEDGGYMIAGCNAAGVASFDWTGITEGFGEESIATMSYSGAADVTVDTDPTLDPDVTTAVATDQQAAAAISFRRA